MPIERSAGAVIFRRVGHRLRRGPAKSGDKKIYYLLLHYELGHWDYVKGHIEKGERPEETFLREAKEETGLSDLKIIPGFKHTIRYFFRGKMGERGAQAIGDNHARLVSAELVAAPRSEVIMKFATFYLAQSHTAKIKLSYEHTGYKWLPYKEARELITFENSKEVLDAANKFLSKSPRSRQKNS